MTESITCQYCGAAIPADSETCIMCGSPVNPPGAPAVKTPEPPLEPQPEVIEPEVLEPEAVAPLTPETPVIPFPEAPNAPSNRGLAVIVEILAGLVGFLGVGWMITGKIVTGIVLMIGYWFFLLGYVILVFSQINNTNGWSLLGLCCAPIFPLISGLVLYLRSK